MKRLKTFKDGVLGKFVGDSFFLWAANMAGVLVSVVATIFVTRELGPEGRGIYTWLLTLAGIGSHVALFGMDTSNRRLAASEPERLPALLRLNIGVIFGLGTIVVVAISFIAASMPMAGVTGLVIGMAVVTVPLNAMMMAMVSLFVGLGQTKRASGIGFWPKLVTAVTFGALVLLGAVSVGGVMAMNMVAALFGVLLPLWWLRREFGGAVVLEFIPYIKTVWRTCSATYIAGLAYYMMQKVDVLMIGAYMGEAPTGFYGVASNIVDLMIMPIAIIAWMLAARIAAAHREGNATGLTRNVVVLTMGLATAGSAFTYAIAPWLIELMFGAEFAPAAEVLRLLCPAVVGLSFFMLMHNILSATGRARYLAIPALAGCVLNVLLNMVLIPKFGLAGACYASIAAYPVAGLVGYYLLRKD